MWFGSQSGLNRYDGYSVRRYEHDPFDSNSLSHNQIQTVFYGGDGVFWIGTYGGLNRFESKTGEFREYTHDPEDQQSLTNDVVVAIERGPRGDLWIGTLDGLNRLDPETGNITRYRPDDSASGTLPDKVVRTLHLDGGGTLWVGTYGGLSRYNPDTDAFETFSDSFSSPVVMEVLSDPRNPDVLWVGTWDGRVSKFNTRTAETSSYRLPGEGIYAMMIDSTGIMWVGTWGDGLYAMDRSTGEFESYRSHESDSRYGLSHDVIYSITEDRSGIVWIGTNGGGIDKYVPWENRFETFEHNPEDTQSITSGSIESIHVDEDGTGWFAVYGSGLTRYDSEDESFTQYTHDPDDPRSLSNDIVNEVFRDSGGTLWVGTNDGLNRFIPETGEFERIYNESDDYSPPEDVIFEITESPSGELWMGTNTSGVAVYDPDSGLYRVHSNDPDDPTTLSDNLVRTVLHDSRGNTWVGTNRGLNRYDPETEGFVRYLHDENDKGSISSNTIRNVYEDEAGRIWVATAGGGVNRYHDDSDSFTHLTTKDGLADNIVHGILEDQRGMLWFSTNRGISVYVPDSNSFRTINTSNGLLSNKLTPASTTGPKGRLFWGSDRGVTIIDPKKDLYREYVPPVVLTRLEVLGSQQEVEPLGQDTYERITLDHGDSFFSIEFAALDYSSPEQNRYAYKLEGFDEEWVKAGSRNYAAYTNLDPGNYVFRVKGSGSTGNWNETGLRVPITIEPPWWQTGYAYAVYLVLAALLGLYAYRRLQQRRVRAEARLAEQERINEELEEKVRERTKDIEDSRAVAERATRAKSLFLANMSHEIRTPLNGLMGMLSLFSQTALDTRQQEFLKYSKASAENLNTLVNDLLDFERIEAGELRLNEEPFSVEETVRYIAHLFSETAQAKGLTLSSMVELGRAPGRVVGDRNRLIQILTNLVNNAVKYTESGSITVRVSAEDGDTAEDAETALYVFEVIDTGSGISEENKETAFGRFTQLDNGYTKKARGVGLGLAIVKQVVDALGGTISVDSELGKGSRFSVGLRFRTEAEDDGKRERQQGNEGYSASSQAASSAPDDGDSDISPRESRPILVCEDEAINRMYLTRYLEGLGYSVDVATDGHQAVSKVQENSYQMVLMDIGMPGISGLEATRRIRAWEASENKPYIPIIALTAHTYDEDIRRCSEAGADAFVSKPIRESQLRNVLSTYTQ